MDILFLILSIASTFLCLIMALPTPFEDAYSKLLRIKVTKILLSIGIIGITWTSLATVEANKTKKITIHPIENHYNTPFFFAPTGNFLELTGNSKFADQNKYNIEYTIKAGLWTYGMYVTENHSWKIVPKQQTIE
jgi:hypothetical protein